MDDTKFDLLKYVFVACLTLPLGYAAGATELEVKYISPIEQQTFAQMFDQAPTSDLGSRLADRRWSCEMYGMRTKMQVKRETKLYDFRRDKSTWTNSGSLPVSKYEVHDGTLTGENAKVRDRVRLTARGQLVSQLSVRGAPSTVIAYSVCRPI